MHQTLEELRAEKEQLDAAANVDDVVDDVEEEVLADEPEAEPKEGEEPWMLEGDDKTSDMVPLAAHVKKKAKLKAKIGEKDDEIAGLKAEIEAIKQGTTPKQEVLKRPSQYDFDNDEDYEKALDKYEDQRFTQVLNERDKKGAATKTAESMQAAVTGHYERAEKLVSGSDIEEETYQKADHAVRSSIESVRPGQGDAIADYLISNLGDGSEKAFFFLGRNKTAQAELQRALLEDPNGIQAAIYLGKLTERISNPQKKRSSAPKPSPNLKGDAPVTNGSADKMLKKYKSTKSVQAAFNIRKEARAAGVDVSNW